MLWFDCTYEFFNVISKSHGITCNFCPFPFFSRRGWEKTNTEIFLADNIYSVPFGLNGWCWSTWFAEKIALSQLYFFQCSQFKVSTAIRMIHRYIRFRSVLNFHYVIDGLALSGLHKIVNGLLIIIIWPFEIRSGFLFLFYSSSFCMLSVIAIVSIQLYIGFQENDNQIGLIKSSLPWLAMTQIVW